jgi:hypothetical protein
MSPDANRGLRILVGVVFGIAIFTLVARRMGYKLGGWVVVRCRDGHLFTTLWIPGVKLKAVDLGVVRFQYCPVGAHWSLVVPARDSDLSDEDRLEAAQHRHAPIP